MHSSSFDYQKALAIGTIEPRVHTTSRRGWVYRLKAQIASWSIEKNKRVYDGTDRFDQANEVKLGTSLLRRLSGSVTTIVQDEGTDGYWWRFKRLCVANNLDYRVVDLHESSWESRIKGSDFLVWRPRGSPWALEEAKTKIFFMEELLGVTVFPSYRQLQFYENKILQYQFLVHHKFPAVETFVTNDYHDALSWIRNVEYPIISKVVPGSGSAGIEMIRSRWQAEMLVRRVFSVGRRTYWPSLRQKGYVYLQRFLYNLGFDLRVIVVDCDHVFGYFRTVASGDFRASGMGKIVHTELPADIVGLACEVAKALRFPVVAVDFIVAAEDHKPYIVEFSNFIAVDTSAQLIVDGVPGKYSYNAESCTLTFEPGRFWLPELALKRFFELSVGL